MATARSFDIIWSPGHLVSGPTNLGAAFPYGGTPLGVTRANVFRPGVKTRLHPAEEFGGITVEATQYGQVPVFGAVLRSWDADALALLFPSAPVGSVSQERVATHNVVTASVRPGYRMSAKTFKLLWAPEDTVQGRALIIYAAIPSVDESAEMALSMSEEFGFGVLFHATPDAAGRVYEQGKLSDLTL